MYYPYLRGKQFELLALRELKKVGVLPDCSNICPIIEPLKEDLSSIQTTLADLIGYGISFALIMNPCRGDFVADKGKFAKWALDFIGETSKCIPAFLVDQNIALVKKILSSNSLENVMLVAQEEADFDELRDLLDSGKVKYVVSPESRTLFRRLRH